MANHISFFCSDGCIHQLLAQKILKILNFIYISFLLSTESKFKSLFIKQRPLIRYANYCFQVTHIFVFLSIFAAFFSYKEVGSSEKDHQKLTKKSLNKQTIENSFWLHYFRLARLLSIRYENTNNKNVTNISNFCVRIFCRYEILINFHIKNCVYAYAFFRLSTKS